MPVESGDLPAPGRTSFSRSCPSEECRQAHCAPLKDADIETLACLAARLAGLNPDQRVTIQLGELTAFDDLAWRYHDFIERAEAAYRILKAEAPPEPRTDRPGRTEGDGQPGKKGGRLHRARHRARRTGGYHIR